MIPLPVLDAILAALAVLFLLVSGALLLDRLRYDRRSRQAVDLHRRLLSVPAADIGADETLRPLLDGLSPAAFHQLTLAGLPDDTIASVAREVRERHGEERLRREARGADDADVWTRIVSLHLLVAGGVPTSGVHRALDEALRSGDPMLAGVAMRLLMRLDDWRAAEVLVRALVDGACPRARIASALERMTVPYATLLEPLFAHGHAPVRGWAARLAGRRRMQAVALAVRRLLVDTDAVVRRAAVEALGRLAEPQDREPVLARFQDPVPMVRAHAARAAAAFASDATATALVELLADRAWIVRAAARDALRQSGEIARPALVRTLWHDDGFAANSAAEVLSATGAITDLARRLLEYPVAHPAAPGVVARFLEVCGPHLRQALFARFTEEETARLHAALRPSSDLAPVPVRLTL